MKAAEYLEKVIVRPEMWASPLNLQTLESFLNGFASGYFLAKSNLQFSDKIDAWKYVVKSRGWKVNSLGIEKEMRAKGKSEREIIDETLRIEIEVWKLLESVESK